jgi:hypothetical protein
MNDLISSIIGTIIGIIIGGVITHMVSRYYYVRAGDDLRKEASELKKQIKWLLLGMGKMEWVKLNRDKEGNIIGYVFKEILAGNSKSGGSVDEEIKRKT